ncbi:MAG TPA: efflux RND transporter periplasmic adaptor subunit [Phycisphaerales bacterium]|nr:efflux RND transporter periplasmic adaptor subunit [Phycisphaerales bacterium]
MYRSPLLNKAIIPVLALGSLAYAVYATGVMRPPAVSTLPLSAPPERPYPRAVAAVGVVEPASELIAVAPRVPGWIQAVHVTTAQLVKAGDPLFTLDDTDLRAELVLREQAALVSESRLARLRALPRPEDIPIARAALSEAQARLTDARNKLRLVEGLSDPGAVSEEERSQRRQAVAREEAAMAARQAELDRVLAGAWKEDIAIADSELSLARAAAVRTRADIDRLTTRAPVDAVVLRVTARAGQYAPAGVLEEPLVTLGSPAPLHVRADVNESDVPRVVAGASATAMVRGGTSQFALDFVRIEPLVIPKKALSGFAQERVDTRVMQIIFKIGSPASNVLVGQQVDIFINEGESRAAPPTTKATKGPRNE